MCVYVYISVNKLLNICKSHIIYQIYRYINIYETSLNGSRFSLYFKHLSLVTPSALFVLANSSPALT